MRSFPRKLLENPQVLFQNNHLLAVHKPAGWHSIPNKGHHSRKCLLTHLKDSKYGGGSRKDFLIPLHRIDQPCTGILLFGKTRKAASRVQSQWNNVRKEYVCILQDGGVYSLDLASQRINESEWKGISGWLKRRSSSYTQKSSNEQKGWSVQGREKVGKAEELLYRKCSFEWVPDTFLKNAIIVRTREGARHMIRVLLSLYNAPIAGDVRYGARVPLPDHSVALHASRLILPDSLILGKEPFERVLTAPLPTSWKSILNVTESEGITPNH